MTTTASKKPDTGKSCVRFTKIDQLPVKLISNPIAKVNLGQFLNPS